MNGITAGEALKYGLTSTVKGPDGRIFIRMSTFLLRVVLAELDFSKLLLDKHVQLADTLPPGTKWEELFKTCRRYKDKTQEMLQLISLLVSYLTWLLLEEKPPACLATLRPGARLLGNTALAYEQLGLLAQADEEVKKAGNIAYATGAHDKMAAKLKARHNKAVELAVKLVKLSDTIGDSNKAALFARLNHPAFDMWARLDHVRTLLAQSKGVKDPLSRPVVNCAEAKKWVRKMLTWARRNSKMKGKQRSEKRLVAFELLVARPVSEDVTAELSLYLEEESPSDGANELLIMITDKEIKTALGPVFGGIVARCVGEEEEEEAATAAASAAARASLSSRAKRSTSSRTTAASKKAKDEASQLPVSSRTRATKKATHNT